MPSMKNSERNHLGEFSQLSSSFVKTQIFKKQVLKKHPQAISKLNSIVQALPPKPIPVSKTYSEMRYLRKKGIATKAKNKQIFCSHTGQFQNGSAFDSSQLLL